MNFGRNDQDDEVIRLLGRLKEAGPEYPSSLYSQRRAAVLAGFAALNLGVAAAGLTLFAQIAKILKGMGLIEKIILGVEVAAVSGLTTYGAITAYQYRNELKQLLFPTTQSAETPFPSLSISSPLPPTEEVLGEGTPTPTGTLTITPQPELTPEAAKPGNTPNAQATQGSASNPEPTEGPGRHLGQTPHSATQKPDSGTPTR